MQTESMDVLYYFDFLYQGNHDEVVAEALASRHAAGGAGRRCPAARVLHFQPTLMMALDEACQLQAPAERRDADQRLPGADGQLPRERRSPCTSRSGSSGASSRSRRSPSRTTTSAGVLDELVSSYVIPNVITPLREGDQREAVGDCARFELPPVD